MFYFDDCNYFISEYVYVFSEHVGDTFYRNFSFQHQKALKPVQAINNGKVPKKWGREKKDGRYEKECKSKWKNFFTTVNSVGNSISVFVHVFSKCG